VTIHNKGQSDIAIGGIAANCGFRPQISPSCGGPGPLSNTVLFGTVRVSLPNGISFRPPFNDFSRVHECDRHTYRRTTRERGNICRHRRHYCCQWCRLIITVP